MIKTYKVTIIREQDINVFAEDEDNAIELAKIVLDNKDFYGKKIISGATSYKVKEVKI
jgi:hypothetical protein